MEDKRHLVRKLISNLDPITDFTSLEEGSKMFNRCSLSPDYIDTFVSYDKDRDVVTYLNYIGEEWSGKGADYWYYIDEKDCYQELDL